MVTLEPEREWIHANEYTTKLILFGVIVLALIGAFAWQRMKLERLQGQYHALALKAVNDSAALDTTRRLALSRADSLRILGDSLAAVTHLTVQVAQHADALDKALGQIRTSTNKLVATVAALNITGGKSTAPVVTDAGGTRTATFAIDSTPYHGHADVALPAIGAGTIGLHLALDPAPLDVVTGCAKPNAQGIRAASVTVLGPKWLNVGISSSQQSPDVCNAVTPAGRGWIGFGDIVYGIGYVGNAHGMGPGAFVGIGGRIGR